jgi:triacylglycerol lipase
MNELSPSDAVKIARGVYRVETDSVSTVHERGQSLGCEDQFQVDDASRFQGRSGSLVWRKLSGFGYVAEGKGRFQGDALFATRGTNAMSDWLSNANIGMQIGPGGYLVHAGFHDVWKTFSPDIKAFIKGRNLNCIHCVGHSLGGALAALTADYLSVIGAGQVKLGGFKYQLQHRG